MAKPYPPGAITIRSMSEALEQTPDVGALVEVLRRAGTVEEPNEDIVGLTILHHGLQCAIILARSDPDDPELHLAGLLHDVGHVLEPGRDEAHGRVGAAYVRPVLGDRVAALIEAHVPAKRYLVTVDASYRRQLSAGSIRTLTSQGESMSVEEQDVFRAGPHADAAIRLRRADEAAKDPSANVPDLDAWLPTLLAVAG
jgi:predicted HD phosphohydrolase